MRASEVDLASTVGCAAGKDCQWGGSTRRAHKCVLGVRLEAVPVEQEIKRGTGQVELQLPPRAIPDNLRPLPRAVWELLPDQLVECTKPTFELPTPPSLWWDGLSPLSATAADELSTSARASVSVTTSTFFIVFHLLFLFHMSACPLSPTWVRGRLLTRRPLFRHAKV